MATSLSDRMSQFVESVLQLNLKVAAFDCDGTLWAGDAGESFFWWELDQGLLPEDLTRWARARYLDYKAGNVPEELMCGEMVSIHRGLLDAEIQRTTDRFFDEALAQGIFREMQELVRRLQSGGCEVWAVSSSSQWLIRSGMRHFGIPAERILATEVRVSNGTITDELVRIPSGPGKPQAIRECIKRDPDAAFGNSQWDVEMLKMTRYPFAVNPNSILEPIAREQGWKIYFPEAAPA